MTAEEILASEVGRKAVEAACAAAWGDSWPNIHEGDPDRERHYHTLAVAAALAILLDPTCTTCEGSKTQMTEVSGVHRVTCPTCDGTGQRPDRLMPADERRDEITEALRHAADQAFEQDAPESAEDFLDKAEFVKRLP